MFDFFRSKKYKPKSNHDIESYGAQGKVAFSNDLKTWEESFDLSKALIKELSNFDIKCKLEGEWVLVDGCIYLKPEFVGFEPKYPSGTSTVSIITICSEDLAPEGFFEYQHAAGALIQESFESGFRSWVEIDLPAIRDALTTKEAECLKMEMSFNNDELKRVAYLSPISHYEESQEELEEEHPFCPCCLLTNTFESFKSFFERDETIGIRLLAIRDSEGNLSADCRVNGYDFPDGEEALKKYAGTWPDRGYEMRKQYVVVKCK